MYVTELIQPVGWNGEVGTLGFFRFAGNLCKITGFAFYPMNWLHFLDWNALTALNLGHHPSNSAIWLFGSRLDSFAWPCSIAAVRRPFVLHIGTRLLLLIASMFVAAILAL